MRMNNAERMFSLVAATLVLTPYACGAAQRGYERPRAHFDTASIRLEQNTSDGDGEALITLRGPDGTGVSKIKVIAPNRSPVFELEAERGGRLGMGQMVFETPEPTIPEVKQAFPSGLYRFVGKGTNGAIVTGEATLSHNFPAAPILTYPIDGAIGIPTESLQILWTPVANATGYFVELEQKDLGLVNKIDIQDIQSTFSPPAGWLLPGVEYVLAVGSIGAEGNRSFTEIHFTTAQ